MKNRIFSLLLALVMLIGVIPASCVTAFAAPTTETEGMTFNDSDDYIWKTNKLLTDAPYSFEVWMKVAEGETGSGSGRVGNIFNNFIGSGNSTICFDIQTNGNPRLYWGYDESKQANVKFDKVDVRTGEWLHLAVVLDPVALELYCYINGELKQTKTAPGDYNVERDLGTIFSLGGDNRPYDHKYYFHGSMAGFSAYGDVLDAEAIANIYANGPALDNASIICAYDLTTAPAESAIADLTGNGYTMYITDPTVNVPVEKEEDSNRPKDYAYSFAVVGDTQYLVENDVKRGTNNNGTLYDWIVANKDKKNIQYVFGLGDITDDRTDAAQWEHAKAGISKLDGVLPYYLIRGNHDDSGSFNSYFNNTAYTSQFVDPDIEDQSKCFFEAGKIDNAYTKFTIGETKYLLMLLDYGANDNVLKWAGEVIAANPTYRVIINTHGYLSSNGGRLENETYSPDPVGNNATNNGVEMWEKLMSKHRNIFLVLCGHDPYVTNSNIMMLQSKGDGGNTVTELLIDPQSLDWDNPNTTDDDNDQQYGMVAMLYFSEDGSKVSVEYISTVLSNEEDGDYLYREENQFDFTLVSYEGNGIVRIEFVGRAGLVDTYRIYYTNGTYQEYTIVNGADGAQGEKGDKGDKGDTGEQGEKGDKGEDGTDGKDGLAGNGIASIVLTSTSGLVDTYTITFTDGSTTIFTITNGADGAQGDKGDKGDKGDPGEQGEKGDKGDTGEQGEKGDKGDTGEQGEKGDTGEDGTDGEDAKGIGELIRELFERIKLFFSRIFAKKQ